MVPPQVTGIAITLDWSAATDIEPRHVNQVLAQLGNPGQDGVPDGIYLALGSVAPPIIQGNDDETRQRAVEALGDSIGVSVQGRYHMSRGSVDVVIKILQTVADQYDAVVRRAEGTEGPDSEVDR
jgi:hypothetical protein